MRKYKIAGSPVRRGKNNGVQGKREYTYAEMQGYLYAKSRHIKKIRST